MTPRCGDGESRIAWSRSPSETVACADDGVFGPELLRLRPTRLRELGWAFMELQGPNGTLQSPKRNPIQNALIFLGMILLAPVMTLYAGITILGMLVFSPALVLIATAAQNRRRRTAAETFRCTQCGHFLGSGSIRLADDAFRNHCKNTQKNAIRRIFRVTIQECDAVCSSCGRQYRYRARERTFVPDVEED